MKRWLIGLSFAALTLVAQALPTVANVEAEVQKGNYAGAETMMREVVAAKPGSARAHYIYAEILAHNAHFADAAQEAALARQLEPDLKFTQPEKFRAFEQMLQREQQGARNAATTRARSPADAAPPAPAPSRAVQPSAGLPGWVWPVGLVVLAVLAFRMLRPGRAVTSPVGAGGTAYGPGYGPGPAPGYGPGPAPGYGPGPGFGPGTGYGPGGVPYGPGGVAGSRGPGWMGVGLAAAGGAAAGMLAERMLERGHEPAHGDGGAFDPGSMAGLAAASDPDARALEDRTVDFGTGNGWDDNSAAASGGGSIDVGGGDDDGNGW